MSLAVSQKCYLSYEVSPTDSIVHMLQQVRQCIAYRRQDNQRQGFILAEIAP